MKKLTDFFVLLMLTVFLTACGTDTPGNPTETPSESQAETDPVQNPAYVPTIPGREDRAFLEDYKNIEISGEHDLRILFVNAGKADAIIVNLNDSFYLIDTGTSASPPMIVAALNYMGAKKLDGLFFTHTDNDHVGGYRFLANLYEIDTIYTSTITQEWTKFDTITGYRERVTLDPGAVVQVAEGAYFEVLGPTVYDAKEENNNSMVLRLKVNGVTTLLAADMLYDEERSLMDAGVNVKCDILKVGHHGKKDATSNAFLDAAKPKYAVITTDREEDDSTAKKSVRNAILNAGAKLYITDESDVGYLFTIGKNGSVSVEDVQHEPYEYDVVFTSVSKNDQVAVIQNTGVDPVDISGWFLFSEAGRELFMFPKDAVIAAGQEITVSCIGAARAGDFTWDESRIWNVNKEDRAVLIDLYGNHVSEMLSE